MQAELALREVYMEDSDREFFKLNDQDRELYLDLIGSKPIEQLMDKYNPLVGFKTSKLDNRTYFKFDILVLGESKTLKQSWYKVNGSVLDSEHGRNIVYTINKANGLYGVYVDNYTNINRNMVLNEVIYINTRVNMSRTEYVELTVLDFYKEDEKIIIEPNSDIYKLYCSKQIDITTLCNLALLQANNYTFKVVEDEGFTKQLDKKFI